jgi:2'-5' RNA ligase
MRLFIAIELSEETKDRLVELQDELRPQLARARFTDRENLHVTIAFLGECSAEQAGAAAVALERSAFAPFPLLIDRIGRFRKDRGDVWWAGVQEDSELVELHRTLTAELRAAGFDLEDRPFRPHITLTRGVKGDAQPREIGPIQEEATRLSLMKSERLDKRLTYTSIYSIARSVVAERLDS